MEGSIIPQTIGGYKIGAVLGRGGFGEVRIGEHLLTGEKVALKFLKKSSIHSLGAAERTYTEIQCLQALKHNNIIKLLQVRFRHSSLSVQHNGFNNNYYTYYLSSNCCCVVYYC